VYTATTINDSISLNLRVELCNIAVIQAQFDLTTLDLVAFPAVKYSAMFFL